MTEQELLGYLNQNPKIKDKIENLFKVSENINLEFTRYIMGSLQSKNYKRF